MTDINRRSFMFGLGATVSAVSVAMPAEHIPVLYGDGEHDDTDALRAFVQGQPFRIAGTSDVLHRQNALVGGVYRITGPVIASREVVLHDSVFLLQRDGSFNAGANIRHCHLVYDFDTMGVAVREPILEALA